MLPPPTPSQYYRTLLKQRSFGVFWGGGGREGRQLDLLLSFKINSLHRTEKRHFPVLLLLMYLKKASLDVFWKLLLTSCYSFACLTLLLFLCTPPWPFASQPPALWQHSWSSLSYSSSSLFTLLGFLLPSLPSLDWPLIVSCNRVSLKHLQDHWDSPVFFYSISVSESFLINTWNPLSQIQLY